MRRRQLNPRQRQGLLLIVIAAVGLIGVLLLIANYVSSVSRQVGPKIQVLQLTQAVARYSPVSGSDLREVSIPAKWAPSNVLRDPNQVAQLVAGTDLPAGTELQQGMLIAPPQLTGRFREIAILVNTETGVAGQLTPGSRVDVIADYSGNSSSGKRNLSEVVVSGVTVLGIGTSTSAGAAPPAVPSQNPSSTSSQGQGQGQGLPVTVLLTPGQVLKVSYAESFAQKVRLSLVPAATLGKPPKVRPYAPGL